MLQFGKRKWCNMGMTFRVGSEVTSFSAESEFKSLPIFSNRTISLFSTLIIFNVSKTSLIFFLFYGVP